MTVSMRQAGERAAGWRAFEPSVRLLGATIALGAAVGAVIGGLGGRLAMRILFITSDDSVKGLESDDGFEIGRFTLGNTIGLVIVTAFIGVIAAMAYLLARPFIARSPLPSAPSMAVLYGILGGAMLVNPDGIDFRVLDPALLGIALFVAISAGFGAAIARLVDAAAADGGWSRTRSWRFVGPPLLVLVLPPFLAAGVVAAAIDHVARTWDRRSIQARVLVAGAFVVMGALLVLGALNLGRDVVDLT